MLNDSLIGSSARQKSGNAANITLKVRNLILREGGNISSYTLGPGNAGDITVKAEKVDADRSVPGLTV